MDPLDALSLEELAERIGTAITRVGTPLGEALGDDDGEQLARRFYCSLGPERRAEFLARMSSERWPAEAQAFIQAILRDEAWPGGPPAGAPARLPAQPLATAP